VRSPPVVLTGGGGANHYGTTVSNGALETPLVPLRRNRNFQLLWVGQVLSDLGSQMGSLAYPLLILALTHSPVIAGTVATVTAVVAFAVRLPAGALADRIDRRRTMIVADGVRAAVLAGLAAGVAFDAVNWPVVLVVAIIDRVGDTIFSPSATAALANIVDERQLESAWAATEARTYGASLIGPTLGGVLYGIGRSVPFVGDAVSYGVSVVTSGGISGRFAPGPTTHPRRGLWREALDGIQFMWRDALLRAVIVQAPLINFAFSGVIFAVILGMRHDGVSAPEIGVVESLMMVGGLLGAIVAPWIQGRVALSRLVVLLTGSAAILFAVAAVVVPSPWLAAPLAVPFFLGPAANAALMAGLLRQTPEELRGRVNNALIQAATGLATLSPVVAGLLVQRVNPHWAIGAFAVVSGVSLVMALTLKGLRRAESVVADVVPGGDVGPRVDDDQQ
jgi:MFS family permease